MEVVLIIENDPVWRCSMRRHLSHIPGLDVVEAASFAEAICLLALERPSLIIFDIDTDERFDFKSLADTDLPDVSIPLLCISGRAAEYESIISNRDGVRLLPKPVSLRKIHEIVSETIRPGIDRSRAPFVVVDYVQLACLGQHSVVVEISRSVGDNSRIVVNEGEIWSAHLGANECGEEAFHALASLENAQLECHLIAAEGGGCPCILFGDRDDSAVQINFATELVKSHRGGP